MPLSFQQHTANGSTTVFSASQIDGYLSVNDIYVYVNDVQKTAGVHYSLQTSPSLQITFLAGNTPALKDEVRIQRITPNTVSGRAVDFADGSVLNANDLDKSALQLLYITQEAEDTGSGALGKQFDQASWNAEGLPITSAATGGGSDSLTTKGYVDNLALYGGGAVNPQAWTFSGDNVLDTFTLSPVANATNPAMFIVEVGGTILRPTTDYTIPTASQIVFGTPPALGTNNIRVRNFGVARSVNDSISTAMIQNDAVTTAKILNANVTAAKLATNSVETAKITDLNVTTGKLADNAVTDAKLRDSAALSVIGRSANSLGDPADIAAATDGHVLRRSGTSLGFGQIANGAIPANTVGLDKLVNMAAAGFLGAAAAGAVTELSAANAKTVLGYGNMADETKTNYVRHNLNQVGAINLIRGALSSSPGSTSYAGSGTITNSAGLESPASNFSTITFQSLAGAFEIGSSRLRPTSATGGTWAVIASVGDTAQYMAIAIRTA